MPLEASNRPLPAHEMPVIEPKKVDDESGHLHRQIIGYLGAALPLLVWVVDRWRPTKDLGPDLLTSISAYYYSSAVSGFCGILAALVVFLVSYRGYKNKNHVWDRTAAWVAGGAAFCVIAFPTFPLVKAMEPFWWEPWIGYAHIGAAGILFLTFAFFSIFLFTKSDIPKDIQKPDKRARNVVHYLCGFGMLACLGWAALAGRAGQSIFVPETALLELFAISWLAKGKADKTAARLVARGVQYVRPGALAADG